MRTEHSNGWLASGLALLMAWGVVAACPATAQNLGKRAHFPTAMGYWGGSAEDQVHGAAIDNLGRVVVVGHTTSPDLPTTSGTAQPNLRVGNGEPDAFVAVFHPDTGLVWATYWGGSGLDAAYAVAVDAQTNGLYVVGITRSADLLVDGNASQPSLGGGSDGFVLALTAAGQRRWSTYLGGDGSDGLRHIARTANGQLWVGGQTASSDMPPLGGPADSLKGSTDLLLARFDANGNRLDRRLIGGRWGEQLAGLLPSQNGDLLLAGHTTSDNLPTLPEAPFGGAQDAFVGSWVPSTGQWRWLRYVGGLAGETANALAQANGRVYLAGATNSADGPFAHPNAAQPNYLGGQDGFLVVLDTAGALQWATYLGTSGLDVVTALLPDPRGQGVLATGVTASSGLATTVPSFQLDFGGQTDALLAYWRNDGTLDYLSYLGAKADEAGVALLALADETPLLVSQASGGVPLGQADDGFLSPSLAGQTDLLLARFGHPLSRSTAVGTSPPTVSTTPSAFNLQFPAPVAGLQLVNPLGQRVWQGAETGLQFRVPKPTMPGVYILRWVEATGQQSHLRLLNVR